MWWVKVIPLECFLLRQWEVDVIIPLPLSTTIFILIISSWAAGWGRALWTLLWPSNSDLFLLSIQHPGNKASLTISLPQDQVDWSASAPLAGKGREQSSLGPCLVCLWRGGWCWGRTRFLYTKQMHHKLILPGTDTLGEMLLIYPLIPPKITAHTTCQVSGTEQVLRNRELMKRWSFG